MDLYFSGFGAKGIDMDPRIPRGPRYRLLSCHEEYIKIAREFSKILREEMEDPFHLLFDSGAFTAWNKNKEVSLSDLIDVYDEMMNDNYDRAENIWLISLDKIPGFPGRTAGIDEINEAIKISDENYKILNDRYGDRVLPVFHQNESTERLHEVVAMAPYICVSPRNDLHELMRVRWASEVHARIPGVRTHGLATTGYGMMTTIPWSSVDSASWVFCATNGAILKDHKMRVLQVSDQSLAQKTKDMHIKTLPDIVRNKFSEFVEIRGFTIDGLISDFKERLVWNRVILTEIMQSIDSTKSHPATVGLFDL